MVNPVPGKAVTTPYKRKGSHWKACGWHTGQDYAAPSGTRVVAARAGVVKHVNYGSAFGSHQIAVVCADGTEDFYAHMTRREAHNKRVEAGQWIGYVGSEGNATGPHLHFERHKNAGSWNCANMDDPMKSHNDDGGTLDIYNYKYSGKKTNVKPIPLDAYEWVTPDMDDPASAGLEFKLIYLNVKLNWVKSGVVNIRVKFVREGGDATAYQDYRVSSMEDADGELIAKDSFLLTQMHMEQGEKGIGGKWYIKISDPANALSSAAVGTRYSKYATVKDKG